MEVGSYRRFPGLPAPPALLGSQGLFEGNTNPTCTPRIPKMMKKAQQMRTMFPMGLREEMSVSTTSFRPGARLMTLERKKREG